MGDLIAFGVVLFAFYWIWVIDLIVLDKLFCFMLYFYVGGFIGFMFVAVDFYEFVILLV